MVLNLFFTVNISFSLSLLACVMGSNIAHGIKSILRLNFTKFGKPAAKFLHDMKVQSNSYTNTLECHCKIIIVSILPARSSNRRCTLKAIALFE